MNLGRPVQLGLPQSITINLYLQPTDTPVSSLISLQLISSNNYAIWSRSMQIGLLGKSKLGFVDGRYPKSKFEPDLHD